MRSPAHRAIVAATLLLAPACVPEAITPSRDRQPEQEQPDASVGDPTPERQVTDLAVDPPKLTMEVETTAPLVATATYEDGAEADVTARAAWQSLDPAVVLVRSPGVVEALSVGQATLRISLGEQSRQVVVDVLPGQTEPRAVSLSVTPTSLTLAPGAQAGLTAEAAYDDGSRRDVSTEATWSSLARGVATVSAGLVTALGEGQAVIEVAFGDLRATASIAVAAEPCAYPASTSSPIQRGSTMPPLAWDTALGPDGAARPLRLEEVYCGQSFTEASVLIFVVGAGWCTACPSYIREVYQQAPQIEAAGGVVVFLEAEDAGSRAASSAYAHQYISNLVGTGHGLRAGDGDTLPTARTIYNAPLLQYFPTAFVVRTRDMRIIADQADAYGTLPFVRIAQDPEADW